MRGDRSGWHVLAQPLCRYVSVGQIEPDNSFNMDTNMAVTVVATCSNLDLVANPDLDLVD